MFGLTDKKPTIKMASISRKILQSEVDKMQGFTKGRLPLKVVFHQRTSSTYHNTLVDLIIVRAVNTPNLSFLAAIHDA